MYLEQYFYKFCEKNRAGAWWARSYAPELSMGLQTAEEVIDVIDVSPSGEVLNVSSQRNNLSAGQRRLIKAIQGKVPHLKITY